MSIDFPTGPYHGQRFTVEHNKAVYFYDKPRKSWIFKIKDLDLSNYPTVTFSNEQPQLPSTGDFWIDEQYYMLTFDGNNWVGVTNAGENTKVYIDDQPPVLKKDGLLWFDSESSDLRVFYNDPGPGDGQWVSLTALNGVISVAEQENRQAILNLERALGEYLARLDKVETSSTDGMLIIE